MEVDFREYETFRGQRHHSCAETDSSLTENAHNKNAMHVSRCAASALGKLMPAYESKQQERNSSFLGPWYTLCLAP